MYHVVATGARTANTRQSGKGKRERITRTQHLLENNDGEKGNLLVRQQLQWGLEKRRVQRVSVDSVEAEIMSGDIGLADCPEVVLSSARERDLQVA
jgi:hypothetical protein